MPTIALSRRSSSVVLSSIVGCFLLLGITMHAAHAAAPAEIDLLLRSGHIARGTPVAVAPGDRVTLRRQDGRLVTLRWSDLADPNQLGSAGASAPTPAPSASVAAAPAVAPPLPATVTAAPSSTGEYNGSDAARVTVQANRPNVVLYRASGITLIDSPFYGGSYRYPFPLQSFVPVCVAPCSATVNPRETYRIVGTNIIPSSSFNFAPGQDVRLDVTAGTAGRRIGGLLLATSGLSVGLTGGVLLGIATAFNGPTDGGFGPPRGVGIALLSVGVTMAAIGIPLLVTSRTRVRFETAPRYGQIALTPAGLVF